MKAVSIIALIIAVLTLAITGYQIRELQNEQKFIAEDVSKLKQEMARSWQHAPKSAGEEWPKYHDATGTLKLITGNRVVIDQDEMPGFMRAMIMSYEIENPEQLSTLRQEDRVKLRLKETETNLTVVRIEKQ